MPVMPWSISFVIRPISEAEKLNGGTVKYLSRHTVKLAREGWKYIG